MWYQRFAQAIRIPAAIATFLSNELGLATSSDPPAEIAIWLTAPADSLTELVDIESLTVVPGSQPNSFTGLAVANREGQDSSSLARIWIGEMCDSMHLDGYETALGTLDLQ